MKKTFLLILIFLSGIKVFSQESFLRVNGGYESGFVGDIGIGLSFKEEGAYKDFAGLYTSLSYEAYTIDDKFYQGSKLNVNLTALIFQLGANFSYINGNGKWRTIFKPEIGITAFGYASLTYTYTVGNLKNFFPEKYHRSGFHLGVNIPLSKN